MTTPASWLRANTEPACSLSIPASSSCAWCSHPREEAHSPVVWKLLGHARAFARLWPVTGVRGLWPPRATWPPSVRVGQTPWWNTPPGRRRVRERLSPNEQHTSTVGSNHLLPRKVSQSLRHNGTGQFYQGGERVCRVGRMESATYHRKTVIDGQGQFRN